MRDRLRAVECPSDVIDQIGGWLTHGVGNSYGNGYDYRHSKQVDDFFNRNLKNQRIIQLIITIS